MKYKDKTPYNDKGQRHGLWVVYHDNIDENLYYKGEFDNDKRVWLWEYYFKDGALIGKSYYIR